MAAVPAIAGIAVRPAAAPSPPLRHATRARGWAERVPGWIELAATLAVVALLWPFFDAATGLGSGRDARFLDRGAVVAGLPEPALPEACREASALADAAVREALCSWRDTARAYVPLDVLPAGLVAKVDRTTQAFVAPLRKFAARREALSREAEAGATGLRDSGDALAALEAGIAPYVERYRMVAAETEGPLPLACAARWARASFAAPAAGSTAAFSAGPSAGSSVADAQAARANITLLLAGALDGRPLAAALADDARLPQTDAVASAGCPGIVESLAAASALMADARQGEARARKNDAMRELAQTAGLQWAGAVILGYAFLRWSRRAARPLLGAGIALVAWALAGWLARVPWPFAAAHGFVQARPDAGWAGVPALFVVAPAALGVLLALGSLARPRAPVEAAQAMSSRLGYAGLAAATGLGLLILLDLSFDGHPGNRYLALYHQGHLWLAMTLLSVLLFARRRLSAGLAWALSIGAEANARLDRRIGAAGTGLLLAAAGVTGVLVVAGALANMRQLTSELGRVWLIGGAAWFFFLRAGPMTERLAREGAAGASFVRYAWPMLFVAGVLIAAMFATHDMGPLLIAGYAAGAFVAAALAMWWHHRSGHVAASVGAAGVLFAAWIAAVTWALFRVGAYDAVTASRLESVAAPFASINDQLALVSWFQQSAPAGGYGIGAVPWCGFAVERCSGVPAQIHSDYTFTALVGLFGPLAAWGVSIGAALWLHRLVRHHGRITRGEPRLVERGGRLAIDGQALISWLALAWVVLATTQLLVTVAGNLALLPLTGVTFPFVSFGMTSLLVNVGFLALCLNIDLPHRARDG